jgi:hypothetical protein
MTATNVEGTFVLNGLVEGPLPDDFSAREQLQQWVRDIARLGVDFHLEITGGNFSLLPDNRARLVGSLGDSPDEAIRQALDQLLKPWPLDSFRRITSTLRSSEFRKEEEVQTIYLVGSDGKVRTEQRTMAADTESPPQRLSPREIARVLIVGALIATALLGVTSLFVDVPALARQLIVAIRPLRGDEVQIDNSVYHAYFHVEVKEINVNAVTLTIKRTELFPIDDTALQSAADAARPTLKKWLAIAALARGSVPCELFDINGELVGTATLHIENLQDKPELTAKIPFTSSPRFRLAKIAFTL